MGEEQNQPAGKGGIPKENFEDENVKENDSERQRLENVQSNTSEIPTSEQQTMEVHHHPHIEKKNFKEYFLEFLMIFLAVTMGFIAENIREHITENKVAGELAGSLYKEAFSDSVIIQQKIANRLKVENDCNHFIDYIRDSSLTDAPDEFYKAFEAVFFTLDANMFEPKDGILTQLRNSGVLRYFKNNKLQEDIGELSVAIANVRIRNAQDFDFLQFSIKPFALKHYDFRAKETLSEQKLNTLVKLRILNIDQLNRQEAVNLVTLYLWIMHGTRSGRYQSYVEKNHQLLETLRKEYHVEHE